jgi:hypothetical protein
MLSVILLNIIMLNVVMLNVVMLNVVMLNVAMLTVALLHLLHMHWQNKPECFFRRPVAKGKHRSLFYRKRMVRGEKSFMTLAPEVNFTNILHT